MFDVTYKFENVEDTASMSDDTEIKAVFHAGISLGIQYVELSMAGILMKAAMPGYFDRVLDQMRTFVREGEISVTEI